MPHDPGRPGDTGDAAYTDPLADTSPDSSPSDSGASASRSGTHRRSVRTGDTLGRYELLDDVGEGGMATVYRARDKELRREVAVKVLFPHLARRDEVVRRFHREARAAAGLEHANILRVYDVGGGDDAGAESGEIDPPYIVMELVRGRSLLGEIEQRGPMLAEIVACIGALLADALAVAHKAGIIHRDIKPANVLVASDGRVLLADFGVARLETEDSLVTKTGALLGTPAYMSPEQASGDTATARSDIYSLGATLYQLATGHLPYTGSPAKVLAQIAEGKLVSAVRRHSAVGPDLSRVIDRMMATDVTARPASVAEVAGELRAIATAGGLADPADEVAAYFADSDAFVRDKTPRIVASLVAAGERAVSEHKLPRAMALADRASSLAPDDPTVQTLIATITEGGRVSRRRRVLAFAGLGVLVVVGGAFGTLQLVGDSDPAPSAAPGDAALALVVDAGEDVPSDAALAAVLPDADTRVAVVADAGTDPRDASVAVSRPRRRDAATVAARLDASVPPPDAAVQIVVAPPVDAAVPAKGFLIVKNDTWCDVVVDGVRRDRASPASPRIEVTAGTHTVTCEQAATGKAWTKQVEVVAGKTVTAAGSLLGMVEITLGVDATIAGTAYRRGQVVRLKAPDRVPLVVGETRTWLDVRAPCTVRNTPVVGCY